MTNVFLLKRKMKLGFYLLSFLLLANKSAQCGCGDRVVGFKHNPTATTNATDQPTPTTKVTAQKIQSLSQALVQENKSSKVQQQENKAQLATLTNLLDQPTSTDNTAAIVTQLETMIGSVSSSIQKIETEEAFQQLKQLLFSADFVGEEVEMELYKEYITFIHDRLASPKAYLQQVKTRSVTDTAIKDKIQQLAAAVDKLEKKCETVEKLIQLRQALYALVSNKDKTNIQEKIAQLRNRIKVLPHQEDQQKFTQLLEKIAQDVNQPKPSQKPVTKVLTEEQEALAQAVDEKIALFTTLCQKKDITALKKQLAGQAINKLMDHFYHKVAKNNPTRTEELKRKHRTLGELLKKARAIVAAADHDTTTNRPGGIDGIDNGCYMNITLQILAACYPDIFAHKQNNLAKIGDKLIQKINQGQLVPKDDAQKFANELVQERLAAQGVQETAEELIPKILEAYDKELPINHHLLVSTIVPHDKESQFETVQKVVDNAFEGHTYKVHQPEKLKILPVSIERKVKYSIKDNNKLTLKKEYIEHGTQDIQFSLKAFVVHTSSDGHTGHYKVYVKRDNEWYYISDQTVVGSGDHHYEHYNHVYKPMEDARLASLYFYERIN